MTQSSKNIAYQEFLETVTRLLYDFDPDGIGSSIDAPLDEYSELAARLLPELSRSSTPVEASRRTLSLFPTASEDLRQAIWAATDRFRAALGAPGASP